MRYPGCFVDAHDYPTGMVTYNGQNMGSVSFNADGTVYNFRRIGTIPFFPSSLRYAEPYNSYNGKSNIELDILHRLSHDEYAYGWHKEDIIARLNTSWGAYSPVTIEMLNNLFKNNPSIFRLDKHKREFIKENTRVKFSKCKISGLFVPNKLKFNTYNHNTDSFKRVYWYSHYTFEMMKAELNVRAIEIERQRERERTATLLKNYSERATSYFDFQKDTKDKSSMYYGIELEYEGRTTSNLTKTAELIPHAILKRDGSVHDGFEICTAPSHISIHAEKFKPFFSHLKDLGLYGASNTGMHVHMSKDACSFLQLGKIFALTNKQDNEEFMVKVAGRDANHYCQASSHMDNKVSYPFRGEGNFSRYARLNLCNRDTFELRMFSTPMTYQDFMHKLEFCKSLFDFTGMSSISIKQADDLNTFLNFIKGNKSDYPHLMQFIKETI